MYNRTLMGSRRWEPVDDLPKTAEDISKYIGDVVSSQVPIIRDEVIKTSS